MVAACPEQTLRLSLSCTSAPVPYSCAVGTDIGAHIYILIVQQRSAMFSEFAATYDVPTGDAPPKSDFSTPCCAALAIATFQTSKLDAESNISTCEHHDYRTGETRYCDYWYVL